MKLNPIIYNKLTAQLEEAKEQGMTKLAACIEGILADAPAKERKEYSFVELREHIHQDLWKSAARVMAYHDLESVDAEKVNEAVVHLASKVLDELELTLGVDNVVIGALEPKVPGENE